MNDTRQNLAIVMVPHLRRLTEKTQRENVRLAEEEKRLHCQVTEYEGLFEEFDHVSQRLRDILEHHGHCDRLIVDQFTDQTVQKSPVDERGGFDRQESGSRAEENYRWEGSQGDSWGGGERNDGYRRLLNKFRRPTRPGGRW